MDKTTPKVGPNGTGFFAQLKTAEAAITARLITVDDLADYLLTKAIAAHKTPVDISGDMIQKKGKFRLDKPLF